jgi:hypothetical protein
MKVVESQRIVLAALLFPLLVLSFLLFLSVRAAPTAQTALLVSCVVFAPLAVFVELAALIVGFSHWRSGRLRGPIGLVSAAVGVLTLLGAVFLAGLLFSGGGV